MRIGNHANNGEQSQIPVHVAELDRLADRVLIRPS